MVQLTLKNSYTKTKKLFSIINDIIYNKPEKHLFSVDDKTYINSRFMNTTGG